MEGVVHKTMERPLELKDNFIVNEVFKFYLLALKACVFGQNMHAALHRTAKSTAKILPCICTSTTTSNESALLNNESDTNTKENRCLF